MKILLCLLILVFPLYRFCEKETQGFSLLRIGRAESAQSATHLPEGVQNAIFDQPFHYLGRGGQAFVFASADGKYVIKFLRRHFTLSKSREERLKKKWERDAKSYQLAFEELQKESGLLYVHLYKSDSLQKKLKIVSPIHISHEVDLDTSVFLLQKRAEPALVYLERLIQSGQHALAQEALNALVDAIKDRCQKGIIDEDPRLHKNSGFLEGKPLFLDVGRLRRLPAIETRAELVRCTARLTLWLQEKDPRLAAYLQKRVADEPL